MNVLPDAIPVVDAKLKQLRMMNRLAGSSDRYSEADFDELIVNQASSISSTLKNAGVLRGTGLRFIARQVANIDVLFGEIDGDELVRLVFVEDKLFKNPESHRKVLAQTLEYANKNISADELLEKAAPDVRAWLTSHRDSLDRLLRRGDFLLIICGDRIQPRLLEIAKPMLDRPTLSLRGVELVLLSLALYEAEGTAIVVPNLVGAVTNFERDLRIEVTVRTDEGRKLPVKLARAERATEAPRAIPVRRQSSERWTEERFLDQARTNAREHVGPEGDWAGSLEAILRRCAETPGLVVRWSPPNIKNGYFSIEVQRPAGDVRVIWVGLYGVGVWSRAIGETLGIDLAGRRAEELAQRLNVRLGGPANDDPELGDDENPPKFHDAQERDILFDWLTRLRDELLSAST